MTKESKQEFSTEKTSQKLGSEIESVKQSQDEHLAGHECLIKPDSSKLRRPSLSKREIMEELSRKRFPWDE